MKRAISLLLTIALLFGLVGTTGVQAFAEALTDETTIVTDVAGNDFAQEDMYWATIYDIEIDGVPYNVTPGTAEIPSLTELDYDADVVTLGEVWWEDAAGNTVTELEDGNVYYLAFQLTASAPYMFDEDLYIYIGERNIHQIERISDNQVVAYVRYSLEPDAGLISLVIEEPTADMNIADLTATVTGNAILESITVCNETTEEYVTGGTFAPNCIYSIYYCLAPTPGYQLSEDTPTDFHVPEDTWWRYGDNEVIIDMTFTTCQIIPAVEVFVVEPVPGGKVSDAVVTVPDDTNYSIYEYQWVNEADWEPAEGTFQAGQNYELHVRLEPAAGYAFSEERTMVTVNGEETWCSLSANKLYADIYEHYSFTVNEISLADLPAEVPAGPAEIPEFYEDGGQVIITNTQWVDTDHNPITTLEMGKPCYLAITMEPVAGKTFNTEIPLEDICYPYINGYEYISDTEAIIYIRYSMLPNAGPITITMSELKEGMNISDITATVTGNATMGEIIVLKEDAYEWMPCTSGKIEANANYEIRVLLMPNSGYQINKNTEILLDGYAFEFYNSGDAWVVGVYFNTYTKITQVQLDLEGVEIGKNISDVKVVLPEDAQYYVLLDWYDTTEGWVPASGKFQDMHKYEVCIDVYANKGYAFDKEFTMTINGESEIYEFAGSNTSFYHWKEISFLKPLEKVEIPALPTSIKKGQTLPADFTAPAGAHYVYYAEWGILGEDIVEKADKDASYLLAFQVIAAPGYEITENTKVFINGKETLDYIPDGTSGIVIYKLYNIGMNEIDRIDLTVPKLAVGEKPGACSVPKDAKYTLEGMDWSYNFDGNMQNTDTVDTFKKDSYVFIAPLFAAKDGYVFAPEVAVYVNGVKVTSLRGINLGAICQQVYCLGRVGRQPVKLTAPKLTVNGSAITWENNDAAAYEVYRSTSMKGTYTLVDTVAATNGLMTFVDESAAVCKTYYYKLKAISADGSEYNSDFSDVSTVNITLDEPVISLSYSAAGKVTLSWEKVASAKSYDIYYATSINGTYKKLTNTKSASYTDTKISTGATRYYKVRAVASKSTYNSAFSDVLAGTGRLATPAVKATVDAATGKPSLSWKKITGAAGYKIYRQLPGEAAFTLIAEQTAVTFIDTTAPIDTRCAYMVQAAHKQENAYSACTATLEVVSGIACPVVKGSIDAATGKFLLTWGAVEGAVKYEIFRSTKSTSGFKSLGTTEGLTFEDASAPGKTYYYRVTAIGQVSKSADMTAVKLVGKCAQPVAQATLDAKTGKPVITWEKVASAKKYDVYRATSPEGKYTKAGTSTKLTFTDTKASIGNTYYYKVVAVGSKSTYNSAQSAATEAIPVLCAQPKVTLKNDSKTGKPIINWGKVTGAAKYIVMYADVTDYADDLDSLDEAYLEENMQSVTTTKTSVTLTDTKTGHVYLVTMVAVPKNEEYFSVPLAAEYVASTCATLKITGFVDKDTGKPGASWKEVDGAEGYAVYRSTKSSSGYVYLGWVDGDSFIDVSAVKGKTYYYKVTAFTEYTESAMSNYAKLKSK